GDAQRQRANVLSLERERQRPSLPKHSELLARFLDATLSFDRMWRCHFALTLRSAIEPERLAQGAGRSVPEYENHRQRRYCARPRSLFQINRCPVTRSWMFAGHASPFTKHLARTRQTLSDSVWTESNSERPAAVSARPLVIRSGGPP